MKKIAIFVEGQTELIFMQKLIKEIIGNANLAFSIREASGSQDARRMLEIASPVIGESAVYYFMICNCHSDRTVKSDILRQMPTLRQEAYTLVLGIRDVFPVSDVQMLRNSIKHGLPNDIPTHIILAVQEVEAWFIAEETHYEKISPKLTIETVNTICNIDIKNDTTEKIPHPSEALKQIYMRGGTTYDKSKTKVERTVDFLDYENLYVNIRKRNNSFNELLTDIESIFEASTNE
jgi:hypothetical protein